jgi:hypothetical protein
MTTKTSPFAPFSLMEAGVGNYSLILSDADMGPTLAIFEEAGSEGGGYAWAGIARMLVDQELPDSKQDINFDPEAGMFCAYGTNRQALESLATVMREVFHNHQRLQELLADGAPLSDYLSEI